MLVIVATVSVVNIIEAPGLVVIVGFTLSIVKYSETQPHNTLRTAPEPSQQQ